MGTNEENIIENFFCLSMVEPGAGPLHRLRNTNDKSLRQIRITGTQFEEKNLFNDEFVILIQFKFS